MENTNRSSCNKPLASRGLISYRYKGPFGWVMIGARDHADAFKEAARSASARIEPENLEIWNATCRMYMPALPPVFETGNIDTGTYVKVLEFESAFKVVVYDADGDVRPLLSRYFPDLPHARAYAEQFEESFA